MSKLENLNPSRVFYYFEQISKIPRGSGNMDAISEFCVDFAKQNGLEYIKDDACNVVIFKAGSVGYENSEPVILQGHLDMVCQKNEDSTIDFEKDGIDLYVDGGLIKARETTLGADNGIAVAIILAILESREYSHPPIEAVFTVDEEVGMLGALKLDMSCLKAQKMINIDSEDEDTMTVSCAGGEDFTATLPVLRERKKGTEVTLCLKGLAGGHSGVEINRGRVNADILMGRVLGCIKSNFDIISVNGGDKPNAIPNRCTASVCVSDVDAFLKEAEEYLSVVKEEIAYREKGFTFELNVGDEGEYDVLSNDIKEKLIFVLMCIPNGVVQMSAELDALVETSLNLGILKTESEKLVICSSLRSNKKSAQEFLENKLIMFYERLGFEYEVSGYYPPWEFCGNSSLQKLYSEAYFDCSGTMPKTEAIHAGLECGVFSSAKGGMDCISIGPQMHGVHTVDEELDIASVERLFEILKNVLRKMK